MKKTRKTIGNHIYGFMDQVADKILVLKQEGLENERYLKAHIR
jgi:hypothetical protein